jgi:hypothetical protein
VVQRCLREGLVGGEGFAVDASLIAADANKQRSVPGDQWRIGGGGGSGSQRHGTAAAARDTRQQDRPRHHARRRPPADRASPNPPRKASSQPKS